MSIVLKQIEKKKKAIIREINALLYGEPYWIDVMIARVPSGFGEEHGEVKMAHPDYLLIEQEWEDGTPTQRDFVPMTEFQVEDLIAVLRELNTQRGSE